MTKPENKALHAKGKQAVSSSAEQAKQGRVFSPDVDIYETDKEIVLLADVPGVKSEGLNIHLEADKLIISGDVNPFEKAGEENIFSEYETGTYQRQFSITELINRDKIDASLKDGVLKLIIPKTDKVLPKKITVNVE